MDLLATSDSFGDFLSIQVPRMFGGCFAGKHVGFVSSRESPMPYIVNKPCGNVHIFTFRTFFIESPTIMIIIIIIIIIIIPKDMQYLEKDAILFFINSKVDNANL